LTASSSQTIGTSPSDNSKTLSFPVSPVSAFCDHSGNVSTGVPTAPVANAIEFDYTGNGQIAVLNNFTSGSVTAVVTRGDNVTTYPLAAGGGSTSSISVSNGTVLTVTVN
jgi:hypothetical protein